MNIERDIVGDKKRGYWCPINSYCLHDPNTSAMEKLVYYYIFTKSSTWKLFEKDVCQKMKIAPNTYRKIIQSLAQKGYLYRIYRNNREWSVVKCPSPTPVQTVAEKYKDTGWEVFDYVNLSKKQGVLGGGDSATPPLLYKIKLNRVITKPKGFAITKEKSVTKVTPSGSQGEPPDSSIKNAGTRDKIIEGLKQLIPPVAPNKINPTPTEIDILNLQHKFRGGFESLNGSKIASVKALRRLHRGTAFNSLPEPEFAQYHNRPFSWDEIKMVVLRYLQACSPDFYPKNKDSIKGMNFDQFVYHRFMKFSKFLQLLEESPKPYGDSILKPDKNPHLTTTFKNFYETYVLNGTKQKEYTAVEENKFRAATSRALEFVKHNRERMQFGMNGEQQFAQLVCNAIKNTISIENIHIGTLASDYTWEHTVPIYFSEQGVMNKIDQGAEYYG